METMTTRKTTPTTGATRLRSVLAVLITLAVMLASLIAVAAPADARTAAVGDTFEVEEEDGYSQATQCGQADKDGSTCIDIRCYPVTGDCLAIWYCKKGNGTVTSGPCGSSSNAADRDVQAFAIDVPVKRVLTTRG